VTASIHLRETELVRRRLQPFTLLGAVADLRIGILTIREKWALVAEHAGLSGAFEVPANLIPSAAWSHMAGSWFQDPTSAPAAECRLLERPWQMPQFNHWALEQDFRIITRGRRSEPIPNHVRTSGIDIFIEPGAILEHAVLNATEGPIYIGRDARIMDGALIRGPVSVGECATVKMGAQLYGGTTIGPFAVAGGEIKNSILSDYANKGHHGYLGDGVVGRWCNLGAGTSCSNVKNNAGRVQVMDMDTKEWLPAGPKCGLLMGDYSRSAINTSFNTGTLTGICANIFGAEGLTPKFIPSFSRGCSGERSELAKEIQSVTSWMRMKGREPGAELLEKIERIYSMTNS
jgi:UDP-N-acetylglucosamine diphosphorylase/glucosamine-1-phosphate N-acetyltransferase